MNLIGNLLCYLNQHRLHCKTGLPAEIQLKANRMCTTRHGAGIRVIPQYNKHGRVQSARREIICPMHIGEAAFGVEGIEKHAHMDCESARGGSWSTCELDPSRQ